MILVRIPSNWGYGAWLSTFFNVHIFNIQRNEENLPILKGMNEDIERQGKAKARLRPSRATGNPLAPCPASLTLGVLMWTAVGLTIHIPMTLHFAVHPASLWSWIHLSATLFMFLACPVSRGLCYGLSLTHKLIHCPFRNCPPKNPPMLHIF